MEVSTNQSTQACLMWEMHKMNHLNDSAHAPQALPGDDLTGTTQSDLLATYTHFLLETHLDELATLYRGLTKKLSLPLMRFFEQHSEAELRELARVSLSTFLTDLGTGQALAASAETLRRWEADELPGLPPGALEPTDLMAIASAQRQAILTFVPRFTQVPERIVALMFALEEFYVESQALAFSAFTRQREQSARRIAALEADLRVQAVEKLQTDSIQKATELAMQGYALTAAQAEGTRRELAIEAQALAISAAQAEGTRRALAIEAQDLAITAAQAEGTRRALALEAQDLAINAAQAEGTRRALAVEAQDLATSATQAEGARVALAIEAQDLATSATQAEGLRVALAIEAQDLATTATQAEGARVALAIEAQDLAITAARAEGTRLALAIEAQDLATTATQAEGTRLALAIEAQDLAITASQAEGVRLALAIEAQGLATTATQAEGVRLALAIRAVENEAARQVLVVSNESLESLNHELATFSYSVSHDLRTPLRALDGFSKVLLEDYSHVLDETGRDYLDRIRRASQRMAELIDDLLELSRITRTDLVVEPINLSAVCAEVALSLAQGHADRQVSIEIAPEMKAWGDRRLVQVIFENLLGNAWKFTAKQPDARISISAEAVGEEMVVCVRDNGAGFDNQYQDKLFRPFSRLVSNQAYKGTGIGLATVQRVVARHGGRVWADGALGAGAAFYFTLLIAKSAGAALPPHHSEAS
jgi:signal transduction histidine kinase